jgi:peptide-methionine (R)-S-oxide reductase
MTMKSKFAWCFALGLVLAVGLAVVSPWSPGGVQERIGIPMSGRVEKSESEWRALLTPEQFRVARQKGTERAFSGEFWNAKEDAVYECVCCGQPLFDSHAKFDSGTGWPSFWQPIDENSVSTLTDRSWLMKRTEVLCSRCDAHLGHVFADGPKPTGLRYCINSVSLRMAKRGGSTAGDAKP